jgi:hypothetical protein
MTTVKGLRDKIDEVFLQCSNSSGIADFRSMVKVFWKVLDNSGETFLIGYARLFLFSLHSCPRTTG